MLDLNKLAQQMPGVSRQLATEAAATAQRLALTTALLQQACSHQAHLIDQAQAWRPQLRFVTAEPIESLDTRVDILPAPAHHTVLATDGSQIAPSHHEIAYCYLLNVGRVCLHYGQSRAPLLDSLPEIFYQTDDLYLPRQWGIRTEEWMGHRRTAWETTTLAELGLAVQTTLAAEPGATPLLAMVDGSLVHWSLDPLPTEARDRILSPILAAWTQLQAARIPFVGYLSASRGSEAINFLRLQACAHAVPNCTAHCPSPQRPGCAGLDALRDTSIWQQVLQPGQRGPLWRSYAPVLTLYGEHTIYFCHLHVGSEVIRLEFPAWVARDAELLQTALSLTLAQVQKGYGYPVALAEAHNQAVVRGGDRARFFALLERELIRVGLRNIGTSAKEARKRGSIA